MHEPVRTCLGCRRRHPRRALVRLVVDEGMVRADPERERPGRGAWLCATAECVERAVGDGGRRLRRALRADSATVTLDVGALRAAVLTAGNTDWRCDADPRPGAPHEAVAAQSRFRTPSDPDASRGVPT